MFPILITVSNPAQLAAVAAAFKSLGESAATGAAEPTPPKPTRAAKAVADAKAAEGASNTAGQTAPQTTVVTAQQLAQLVTELAKTKRAEVVAILGNFGVAKASLLKPDQVPEAWAAFKKLEAGASATAAVQDDSLV